MTEKKFLELLEEKIDEMLKIIESIKENLKKES
jgi:hypothetical protein